MNSSNYDNARIGILLLDTGERRTVLEGGTDARYVPSGHLVYLRAGSLFAVPFDLERLAVTGPPVPVLDGISVFGPAGFAHYSVSPSGSLVYLPLDPKEGESGLVSVDRKGAIRAVTDLRQDYSAPRLSPDGRRLAVCVGGQESGIWVYDFTRNAWERLISGGLNALPVWSSDGERVAFASNRGGPISVFWMPVDRSASAEQLTNTERWVFPYSASPDGRTLLVETQSPATGSDISVLSLEGERTLRPFLHTSSNETSARFSPDGRFITYESNESGRSEVYVTPYPGPGGRWQVSTDGGASPVWSRDGRELFYRSGEKMMTASVETRPTFRAGVPKLLFELGRRLRRRSRRPALRHDSDAEGGVGAAVARRRAGLARRP